MARGKRGVDQPSYIERISAKNKTPEEVERITQLYKENIDLAHSIAKKYYKTGYWEFDDAVQIARMGLWKACLIWDPGKFKLSTLATNVITRDFIDYDMKQKKQPGILFNLEENCVTDDLSLGDVLVDEKSDSGDIIEDVEAINYINEQIVWLLEDIAYDKKLPVSYVKLVYLVYIESTQYSDINMRSIKFMSKQDVMDIITILKQRLGDIMKDDNIL